MSAARHAGEIWKKFLDTAAKAIEVRDEDFLPNSPRSATRTRRATARSRRRRKLELRTTRPASASRRAAEPTAATTATTAATATAGTHGGNNGGTPAMPTVPVTTPAPAAAGRRRRRQLTNARPAAPIASRRAPSRFCARSRTVPEGGAGRRRRCGMMPRHERAIVSGSTARPPDLPATSDGFVRGLSEAIGGPLGEHAVRPEPGPAGSGPRRGSSSR